MSVMGLKVLASIYVLVRARMINLWSYSVL